jgi:hypothetical protein
VLVAARDELEKQVGVAVGVGEVADLIDVCAAAHTSIYVQMAVMWSRQIRCGTGEVINGGDST